MPEPSFLRQWAIRSGLALVLFIAIVELTSPLGSGGFLMALGGLWLINALLLRMGIMKPGSFLGGETPLGVSLIGIGAIGAGVFFPALSTG